MQGRLQPRSGPVGFPNLRRGVVVEQAPVLYVMGHPACQAMEWAQAAQSRRGLVAVRLPQLLLPLRCVA